jgi:hypothetical protein
VLDENDGCNGVCLTAGDIGMGPWAGWNTIAFPHPECPAHGAREEDYPPMTPEEEEECAVDEDT